MFMTIFKAKLKAISLIYFIVSVLLPGMLLAEEDFVETKGIESNVVASVNGTAITSDMVNFLSASREQGPLSGLERDRKELLESLITTELLFDQAKQAKLEDNPLVSLELELAKKTLLSQLYVMRFMDQLVIDEAVLRAEYDSQSTQAMVQMEFWRFDTKAEAQTFLDELERSPNKRNPEKANQNGEIQAWQLFSDYSFSSLPEAESLSSGQWLLVPVKSDSGWQVWRCLEKSLIPMPSFEASREGLRQEIASQRLQQHIASLRSQAQIKLYRQD